MDLPDPSLALLLFDRGWYDLSLLTSSKLPTDSTMLARSSSSSLILSPYPSSPVCLTRSLSSPSPSSGFVLVATPVGVNLETAIASTVSTLVCISSRGVKQNIDMRCTDLLARIRHQAHAVCTQRSFQRWAKVRNRAKDDHCPRRVCRDSEHLSLPYLRLLPSHSRHQTSHLEWRRRFHIHVQNQRAIHVLRGCAGPWGMLALLNPSKKLSV